ncbi:MAG: four helix bundle protein [bacterium]
MKERNIPLGRQVRGALEAYLSIRPQNESERYEFDEEGRQIRRSSKSIPANIAEGYGRKRYRGEYVRFTVYALSSFDETTVHRLWAYQ